MIELRVLQGEPDAERKSCCDCRHMKAAVTWWCTNKEASKAMGTSFPGVIQCPFWEPAKKYVRKPWYKRLFDFGFEEYILINCGEFEEKKDG